MSRVGKAPVKFPAGVELKVEGNMLTVKGPKGTLIQSFDNSLISFVIENGDVLVKRANDDNETKAKHGLYRALVHDMRVGVTEGYKKTLIVNGRILTRTTAIKLGDELKLGNTQVNLTPSKEFY